MNNANLINMQFLMFACIFCGLLARKLGYITTSSRKNMTDLILMIFLPCNLFGSFLGELTPDFLKASIQIFLASCMFQVITILGGRFLFKNAREDRRNIYQYSTIVSNAGFLGSPVCESLYGQTGVMYGSIYLIPLRICMWSFGLSCFTKIDKKNIVFKTATHPCMVAVYLGLIVMFCQFHLPAMITGAISSLGRCTTPMSMMMIGSLLAEIKWKELLDPILLLFSIFRLVILPAIILVLCMSLKLDPMVTAISTVLVGMPAGNTTALLAAKYDGDAHFASKIVTVSTLLSLVTISMWYTILQMVLH